MLYEITSRYKELVELYNSAETQEEMDSILEELELVDDTLEDKAEQIVKAIRNFNADALQAKNEKDYFAAKESAAEQRAVKLDKKFAGMLTDAGLKTIRAGAFNYSIHNNRTPSLI